MKTKRFNVILLLITIFTLLLAAAVPLQEGVPFFEGYSAEDLFLMAIAAILGLSQGLWPEVSVFNMIKSWLGVKDRAAHYLVLGLCGILSGLALFVSGEVNFASMELTLRNFIELGGIVYAMSQIGYQRLKAKTP